MTQLHAMINYVMITRAVRLRFVCAKPIVEYDLAKVVSYQLGILVKITLNSIAEVITTSFKKFSEIIGGSVIRDDIYFQNIVIRLLI